MDIGRINNYWIKFCVASIPDPPCKMAKLLEIMCLCLSKERIFKKGMHCTVICGKILDAPLNILNSVYLGTLSNPR